MLYDALEARAREEREADLMRRLPGQVAHAKENTLFYLELLAGIDPRSVDSRAALAALPLTRKSELVERQRAQRPFGGLNATAPAKLARIFMSPGPIYDPEGREPDFWRTSRALFAAGFRAGDVALNCFSYHFSPAASMFETGLHHLGCAVIPGGTGQTEMQVRAINDLEPVGYVGTPSFLKIILEKAGELGLECRSLRRALVSGEAFMPAVREFLSQRGLAAFQAYGTADLGVIAYESEAREGLVVNEDIIVEIVRPGTGDPVSEGEVGEVVVTTFNRDYPLLRFATGDLSAVLAGASPCGRTNFRIKGWMGARGPGDKGSRTLRASAPGRRSAAPPWPVAWPSRGGERGGRGSNDAARRTRRRCGRRSRDARGGDAARCFQAARRGPIRAPWEPSQRRQGDRGLARVLAVA
jgi:phenylacetate-CoA ligase